MPLPSDASERARVIGRARRLHAMLGASSAHEAEAARQKLLALLAKHGLTWNHLDEMLRADADVPPPAADTPSHGHTTSPPPEDGEAPRYNVLDLVEVLIGKYVAMSDHHRWTAALWMLHTYKFDSFVVTPRLALLSPVRGCGKTTLELLMEQLVANPARADSVTAASLYRLLGESLTAPSLLIDEGDNLGLLQNRDLRMVMNSGHRRGGCVWRAAGRKQGMRRYYTFAPLAVAAIGALPLPLMHRCVIINMQRRAPDAPPLERLDELDPGFLRQVQHVRAEIQRWARTCELRRDPAMPPQLQNRAADNWRILLAIADDLGHGGEARAAALALAADRPDEDPAVLLLADIREVFETRNIDRISSAALVEALHAAESDLWQEYRGAHDDEAPRRLTQATMARLLARFGIRPQTVWALGGRQQRGPSSKGYYRSQFEDAWARYCPAGTPARRHAPPPLGIATGASTAKPPGKPPGRKHRAGYRQRRRKRPAPAPRPAKPQARRRRAGK